MAVRVVPPRGRPEASDPGRYPGLTAEERGLEVPATPVATGELGPPPPLWVLPSDLPQESRAEGFVGALPEADRPEPPPPPEGLFDVPGLLERLWLARALEAAHHERAWGGAGVPTSTAAGPGKTSLPSGARSGGVPTTASTRPGDASRPEIALLPPSPSRNGGRPPDPPVAVPFPRSGPRSWICPYCYLTNDAGATTCRGCRSGTLHL